MKYSWIINIPKKPKKIYDYTLEKSYYHWIISFRNNLN